MFTQVTNNYCVTISGIATVSRFWTDGTYRQGRWLWDHTNRPIQYENWISSKYLYVQLSSAARLIKLCLEIIEESSRKQTSLLATPPIQRRMLFGRGIY